MDEIWITENVDKADALAAKKDQGLVLETTDQ